MEALLQLKGIDKAFPALKRLRRRCSMSMLAA